MKSSNRYEKSSWFDKAKQEDTNTIKKSEFSKTKNVPPRISKINKEELFETEIEFLRYESDEESNPNSDDEMNPNEDGQIKEKESLSK